MSYSDQLQSIVSIKFDESVLVNALKDIFNLENVEIKNIEFKSGVKKGDSYLSTISNFTVEASGKHKNNEKIVDISLPIISKSLPKAIGWRKTFRSTDFFNNECIFYNTVWKAMNEFQLEKNVEIFTDIPLCISAYADGIHDYVLLENVNPKGYKQLARCDGIDYQHAQSIMNVFARFHALGLAFKDQKPTDFEKIGNSLEETYFSEKYRKWYTPFQTQNLFPVVFDSIKKQLPESYLKKFREVAENDFFGKLMKYCESRGALAVVTHGDAWAPNFLFKYDAGNNLEGALMLDFQLARYASLALDILFFLYSCTDQSLRMKYWDVLIEEYHNTFIKALKQLGSSPDLLTLDYLKSEIKSCALFGVGMSMEAIAMSLLEDDEVADLEGIEGEEVPLEKVWILHLYKDEKNNNGLQI